MYVGPEIERLMQWKESPNPVKWLNLIKSGVPQLTTWSTLIKFIFHVVYIDVGDLAIEGIVYGFTGIG
jgi:hypothetical protein